MAYIMWRFSEKRNPVPSKTTHHVGLEVAWTIVPVIILLVMVVPSMQLLYYQDVIPESDMTIKVTGNTWNWEYAYPDHPEVESFISNMLEKEDAAAAGKPYLLGSDAPLVVPVDTTVKVLVTSSNNLHSFAMPAFGINSAASFAVFATLSCRLKLKLSANLNLRSGRPMAAPSAPKRLALQQIAQ